MKHLGIFLGYAPNQRLRKEGLGRLLAFLISGMLKNPDVIITIAHPCWFKDEVALLLKDHCVDVSRIRFLSPSSLPYALRLSRAFKPIQEPVDLVATIRKLGIRSRITRLGETLFGALATCDTPIKALLIFPPLFLFCIIASVLLVFLLPVAMIALAARAARKGCSNAIHKVSALWAQRFPHYPLTMLRRNIYDIALGNELKRLTALINTQSHIQAWLTPTLFWHEVKDITARKVVVAPDIVFMEYPTQYASTYSENVFNRQMKTLAAANHFITYSAYVRDEQLGHNVGVSPSTVSVIRHGRTSLEEYLSLGGSILKPEDRLERAIEILRHYSWGSLRHHPHWRNQRIWQTPYLFYSSQARPNKNIFMLLRLIRWLTQEQRRNLRLILTCAPSPRMEHYIFEHKLESVVLFMHDVPSEVLAALNACAALSITPTLFEGGFPFTFCEAFSVGTPSLLSNIPVIREVTDKLSPELRACTLFDPYNIEDLKTKTLWALAHRAELLALQQELYDAHPPWDQVAADYIAAVLGTESHSLSRATA